MNKFFNKTITRLEQNEIFVFGSNEGGIHGKGAAKIAFTNFGAIYGVGFGAQETSFAIPTKDKYFIPLPIYKIKYYVEVFINFTKEYNNKIYYVTAIGCGLAGYLPSVIAPLFTECLQLDNIKLTSIFKPYLIGDDVNGKATQN